MGKRTPPLAAETEALREAYAALNRNDIPAMVRAFDPQIERIEPADFPAGGTYRGLAAVQAHIVRARETWAEGSCEPEQFMVAGDKIVVFLNVRVRLKQETEWREGSLADVFTFRNGKAIEFRTFAERQKALEWAGVKASDANGHSTAPRVLS
jgi:ketosteroid isomerase-like protein